MKITARTAKAVTKTATTAGAARAASRNAATTAKARALKPRAAASNPATVKAVAAKAAKASAAKTGAAKTGMVKSGVAKTGAAKSDMAKSDMAKTSKQTPSAPVETKLKAQITEAPKAQIDPAPKAPEKAAAIKPASAKAAPVQESAKSSASAPVEVKLPVEARPAIEAKTVIEAKPAVGAKPAASAAPSAGQPVVAAKAKPVQQKHSFKLNEFIVYPAHGVGQIIGVEVQEVAGFSLELFVVSFIKDKMILKVPTSKVVSVGMRKLAEGVTVEKALGTLSGRARVKRTMWSRRAQEYESKINSGDLGTIAEVVRDLYRSESQPEQSYSERQLYEAALDRMAREIAVVKKLIDSEALKLIETFLMKGPKRGVKNADDAAETDVERAA